MKNGNNPFRVLNVGMMRREVLYHFPFYFKKDLFTHAFCAKRHLGQLCFI